MMTELSPAAQAAIDAWWNASDGEYIDGVWTPNRSAQLAAALEAVVAKTKMRQYGTCWICDANELLAIAAELRGDTTTNQEDYSSHV